MTAYDDFLLNQEIKKIQQKLETYDRLLVELGKELATYKKALELMAEDSVNARFHISKSEVIDFYLSKAKEANND